MLKIIGYWNNKNNNYPEYPNPEENLQFWNDIENNYKISKIEICNYLKYGFEYAQYRGSSSCRICNSVNGSREFHDNYYCWPDGLVHYIECHNIEIPLFFIEHIVKFKSIPILNLFQTFDGIDVDFWVNYNIEIGKVSKELANFVNCKSCNTKIRKSSKSYCNHCEFVNSIYSNIKKELEKEIDKQIIEELKSQYNGN